MPLLCRYPPQACIPSPTRKANMLAVPSLGFSCSFDFIGKIICARDNDSVTVTLYSIHYTLYSSILYTLHSTLYTLYSIHYTLYSTVAAITRHPGDQQYQITTHQIDSRNPANPTFGHLCACCWNMFQLHFRSK